MYLFRVRELECQLEIQRRERLLAEQQLSSTIMELERLEKFLKNRESLRSKKTTRSPQPSIQKPET